MDDSTPRNVVRPAPMSLAGNRLDWSKLDEREFERREEELRDRARGME